MLCLIKCKDHEHCNYSPSRSDEFGQFLRHASLLHHILDIIVQDPTWRNELLFEGVES